MGQWGKLRPQLKVFLLQYKITKNSGVAKIKQQT